MKKVLVLLLTLIFTLTMSLGALGAPGKSNNGNGNSGSKSEVSSSAADKSVKPDKSDNDKLKELKQEMNEAKKALTAEASQLQAERDELQALYDDYILENTEASLTLAAELLPQLSDLDSQLAERQAAIKQCINERFMIIKTPYSGEELLAFEDAEALIAQMYADITEKSLTTITVKNNLVKLEGPTYLKGGKIMFPLRALAEMGATVEWDLEAQTVTVSKDGTTVVFAINSETAAKQQELLDPSISLVVDDADSGALTGTVTGSITDPASGEVTGNVNFTITAVATDLVLDEEGVLTDGTLTPMTVTGEITDPVTGEVIGTVTGELSGTLSAPIITITGASTDVNTVVPTEISCGRAFVPLQTLAEMFGLDVEADADTGTITVDDGSEDEGSEEEVE